MAFSVVEDAHPETETTRVVAHPAAEGIDRAASAAVMLALRTLSQRAVASARTWFTLGSVASTWALWQATPDPTPTQIGSLTIYAGFILAANIIVRRW